MKTHIHVTSFSTLWMLRGTRGLRITRGLMLPGPDGGELHAALRARLREAEKAGLVECTAEGVGPTGHKWEEYRLSETGEIIVAGMLGQRDRRDAGV